MKTMMRQAVPLQPMETHGEADLQLQPMEDSMPEQVDAPKGGCDSVETLSWNRLLVGSVDTWREDPTPEQVCWQDL